MVKIWEKEYSGFESLSDIDRDISEAFDEKFNPSAKELPPEFEGNLIINMSYLPEGSHSFKAMIGFAMADAEQELKSSEKFFDEVGIAVANGKIELIKHIIEQYELG